MNKDTDRRAPTASSPPARVPNNDNTPAVPDRSERLKALLDDWNRPLEQVDWSHTSIKGDPGDKPRGFLKRLRRERRHRRDLHRAREAAAKAFHVRPRHSARKRATVMLSAGAVGLAAFTGPPMARHSAPSPGAHMVLDDVEGGAQAGCVDQG